jgi:hypothetical protein
MQYKIVPYKIDAYGAEYRLGEIIFPDKKNGPDFVEDALSDLPGRHAMFLLADKTNLENSRLHRGNFLINTFNFMCKKIKFSRNDMPKLAKDIMDFDIYFSTHTHSPRDSDLVFVSREVDRIFRFEIDTDYIKVE